MPASKDRHYDYRSGHRRSSSKRHRRTKSHSTLPRRKRSSSPSKLSLIAGGKYAEYSPRGIGKNRGTDLFIANGSIYAVKVEPVSIVDCIKLRRINPVIKPDIREEENSFKMKSTTSCYIEPVNSIRPFRGDSTLNGGIFGVDSDSTLTNSNLISDESDRTNVGDNFTTKLNDIILRMESTINMDDESRYIME
ncbi:unnamed protein product [Rodentolepis nana]|uniref:Protein kinase domain-containing protein n=1 Tax=Rodentolepis nana TaxID=102285 RepID=A0A0R3TYA2_RODNA|nr:unnamed protein product [Rodentolepis nana]